MNDILPGEVERWRRVEAVFCRMAELHGYAEVRTPLIEHTELFAREIGEGTDVVEKEMYSFSRHGDELTVRPEGTAGVARAYVEHSIHGKEPITRWYYAGAMFRGERPAKGRYRQFYQIGCEHFGDPGPLADAEMIDFVAQFLRAIEIPDFVVHVNSLGSGDTRVRYREALRAYFAPLHAELSDDSRRRLEKNPLRILDSKDPRDKKAAVGAPSILDLLDEADRAHFDGLLHHLDVLGVAYVIDPSLVRGLDYYTRTLFELKTTTGDLGAQNTLVGGGRYDNMVESLGGPKVPAVGFAMGMERLLATSPLAASRPGPGCYFAPLCPAGADQALVLARELRALGVPAEVDGRALRLKPMLRRADALKAKLCVLIGDGELERGVVTVKDLAAHTQDEIPLPDAARVLAERVSAIPDPEARPA
jgi:histidyl-tRNA synthetase